MKQLPKRGPVVLWTGPNQSRLIAELFEAPDGLVVMRAHWPDADSEPAAKMIDPALIRQGDTDAPYLAWTLEEDDAPALQEEWAEWLKRRDQDGTTREDARQAAEGSLGMDINDTSAETVKVVY